MCLWVVIFISVSPVAYFLSSSLLFPLDQLLFSISLETWSLFIEIFPADMRKEV